MGMLDIEGSQSAALRGAGGRLNKKPGSHLENLTSETFEEVERICSLAGLRAQKLSDRANHAYWSSEQVALGVSE